MKIELLETAGWYTIFKQLRQSYKLDNRSNVVFNMNPTEKNTEGDRMRWQIQSDLILHDIDIQLLSNLVKSGDSHSKIIRGIQTYVEIEAPRYWWQEWITYCIGVLELNPTIDWVALNSESTMHTLMKQEHLYSNDFPNIELEYLDNIEEMIMNEKAKDTLSYSRRLSNMKNLLPEGYLQKRTYMVSYQAWRRIYEQRKHHILEEWSKDIVGFIEGLPFSKELITVGL